MLCKMHRIVLICVAFVVRNTAAANEQYELKRIFNKIYQRRYGVEDNNAILGRPKYPEHLSEAEPILRGHTLVRPSLGMLKSAVKFPHRDNGASYAYGNHDNLETTYGKTNHRGKYADFRKSTLLESINKIMADINNSKMDKHSRMDQRRYENHKIPVIAVRGFPEMLPMSKKINPGDNLLRPSKNALLSSAKYPHGNKGASIVYGNLDNLGITYGKTANRVLYSNFRKSQLFRNHGNHTVIVLPVLEFPEKQKNEWPKKTNRHLEIPEDLLIASEKFHYEDRENSPIHLFVLKSEKDLSNLLQKYTSHRNQGNIKPQNSPPKIISLPLSDRKRKPKRSKEKLLELGSAKKNKQFSPEKEIHSYEERVAEEENNANEIQNEQYFGSEELDDNESGFRRTKKKSKSNFHDPSRSPERHTEEGSSASTSSEYEKNPGNPLTIHRNRYKQNWPWNFKMTGDHMNIDPYGPKFPTMGPSGSDLFFGRKWWYFNQDDYKTFR